ncbi:hypothetical protein [Oceanomicrobium pacificus]|uniref:Uncharacterized protein n=1 Tax=Oceanomicrobium pacificus TaxID=2692916 RepID=A0A6B0TRG8_9RHOB|nr:hypothetical protein [Oceanomicrobium pacificus]MXU65299.1 hypothetical protein [Oceanomicrobium pacificus]
MRLTTFIAVPLLLAGLTTAAAAQGPRESLCAYGDAAALPDLLPRLAAEWTLQPRAAQLEMGNQAMPLPPGAAQPLAIAADGADGLRLALPDLAAPVTLAALPADARDEAWADLPDGFDPGDDPALGARMDCAMSRLPQFAGTGTEAAAGQPVAVLLLGISADRLFLVTVTWGESGGRVWRSYALQDPKMLAQEDGIG